MDLLLRMTQHVRRSRSYVSAIHAIFLVLLGQRRRSCWLCQSTTAALYPQQL